MEAVEIFEFILLVREKLEFSEQMLSDGFSDAKYESRIRGLYSDEAEPTVVRELNHRYRMWIYILNFGD